MVTTRSIAADRSAGTAARPSATGMAADAAGDGFLTALGLATRAPDRGSADGARDAPREGDGDRALTAPSTSAKTDRRAAAPRHPPAAANEPGDPVSPGGTAGASRAPVGSSDETSSFSTEWNRQEPSGHLPAAIAAMLLALPPLPPLPPPLTPASPADPRARGDVGATSGQAARTGVGVTPVPPDTTLAAPASGGVAAVQRMDQGTDDAPVEIAASDPAAQSALAFAAGADDRSHRAAIDNPAALPGERAVPPGPALAAAATALAVQPVAGPSPGGFQRSAAHADAGGSGAALAATLAGAGPAPSPASSIADPTPASAGDGGAADLAKQVAGSLAGALAAGRLEVVLQLHPAALGELHVRVAVSGHEVAAWFTSPLPQVQQALAQGMGQLQAGLATAGYNLTGAWVGGDAWASRGRRDPPGPPSRAAPAGSFTPPVAAAPLPAARSGMSLYV